MPTPVSAARPCLSPEASTALDAAVSTARRRAHAQTTSLHFISSLLTSPLLRDALSRSRSTAYSPRLQFKALELCFSVALDRLPSCSASSSPASSPVDEPPVSNSLMAAIKRSQANQRRNPDTFHLYQQHNQSCSSSSSFSGVKVELQQLLLAILDDPVVSRVFGEAGFRSSDIKIAILRPAPPPMLRFQRRCPPLFLCSFSNGSDELIGSVAGSGEEHCRIIGDILSRVSGNGRNPMLVGAGAGDAAGNFAQAVNQNNWSIFPHELEGIKILNVTLDDADRIEEMVTGSETGPGSVLSVGDLNELVEGEKAGRVVSEVTRILEMKRSSVWVMAWTVNYETYSKFLSRYPLLDKDWELQLLPITSSSSSSSSARANIDGFNKSNSFVPFGGFFPETYEPVVLPVPVQYQSGTRCQSCNYKYEQEAMTIIKANSMDRVDQVHPNLPPWIPKSTGLGDTLKVSDENKLVLNGKILNLQKKWTEYCHRLHSSSYSARTEIPENNYPLFPHFIPIQNSPPLTGIPKMPTRPVPSISLPSNPNQDLISKLDPRNSKSEQINLRENQTERNNSPSINSVTTDLALATPRGSHVLEKAPKTLNPNLFDLTSYKSFIADLFKRVGRQEEALRVVSEVVVSFRSGLNPNPSRNRRGVWLGFKGGDIIAQRRTASALAEMVSGGKENLVSVDLSRDYFDSKFRGKTSIDYIASEITKMPSAVVYVENVDKADILVRNSLCRAFETGKLRGGHGREIGIDGRIFLLASRRKGIFSSSKEYFNFNEERILDMKGRKMKIIIEKKNVTSVTGGKVVISRRCESAKRKNETCYGSPKRPNLGLDLNVPIEESVESCDELDDNNINNNSVSEDDMDGCIDGLFQQIDVAEFRDFNFDMLADEILGKINKIFCEKFGVMSCNLEIENNAMEQILASAWTVEQRGVIYKWVETVLGTSFGDLNRRGSRFLGFSQFRLVVCEEDALMEDEIWNGVSLLPSRIIISN